ncbi:thioredoxin domain-containing protein [Microbacterium gorillae]|uniref:thioredoxin domain-containing protein n=1 Tax=Microbacterium gorillae TaxID=1231063 RepID=UPI000694EF55|nr:thioredoxin domain-containing protein [Microbacterium gorillae]
MANDETNDRTPDDQTPNEETPQEQNPAVVSPAPVRTGAVPVPTGPVATDASARTQVRQRAEQVKAKQRRDRVIRRSVLLVVLVAIVAAIAVVVTSVLSDAAGKPQVAPANVTANDGIHITADGVRLPTNAGNGTITSPTATATPDPSATADPASSPAAPVKVRVYFDFLDPDSATFQLANAKQLARMISDGSVDLSYHPVATLTSKSNGTKYSLRAAAASACVASYAPNYFFAYTYELLAKQPSTDGDGMTDASLADLAAAVGAGDPQGLRGCITNGTYQPWVKAATDRAKSADLPDTKQPLNKVPLVLVNGTPYIGALDDPAEFMAFVMDAESKAYYATPTASPTDSPTPAASDTATPAPTEAATPEPTESEVPAQ